MVPTLTSGLLPLLTRAALPGILPGRKVRWDRKGAKWRRRYDRGTDADKYESLQYRPKANESKNQIIIWMMYWPISGTWWLISDFVRELFVSIYYQMGALLDHIAARHTKGIDLTEKDRPRP